MMILKRRGMAITDEQAEEPGNSRPISPALVSRERARHREHDRLGADYHPEVASHAAGSTLEQARAITELSTTFLADGLPRAAASRCDVGQPMIRGGHGTPLRGLLMLLHHIPVARDQDAVRRGQ